MKLLLILSMLLIPTTLKAAPSNSQLYQMWQGQNQLQMMDDMDRDAKVRRLQNNLEEIQTKRQSTPLDSSSDLLLLLMLKNHPELLKELQK